MRLSTNALCAVLSAAILLTGTGPQATGPVQAEPALADARPTTLIILDGSGSMWARLDGDKRSKVDLARDAVRAALDQLPAGSQTGLMSFGHRRSGDCSDIELMVPLSEGDSSHIITRLDKLDPRGKGPIAGALREAAKVVAGYPNSSIILIHDNADNCRQDACEAASEIAQANPKLKIHLVSLGLDAAEFAASSCIAKITGGEVFEVKAAADVGTAVSKAMMVALRVAPDMGRSQVGAAGSPEPAPAPQADIAPPPGPPALKLSARLGAKALPANQPVHWLVTKSNSKTAVFEGSGNSLTVPLSPGPYDVEAKLGYSIARGQVTATDVGPTPITLALDAAMLHLNVTDLSGGAPSATALVTLMSGLTPPETRATLTRPLWIGPARDADFVLPTGSYVAHITDGLVERDEAFTLNAGDQALKEIVLGAGRLELTIVAKAEGRPLEGVLFLIAKDDPDAPNGRREIARSSAIHPAFSLASGTYYVTARLGSAEVRQRVGIGAGDTVKLSLMLGLGTISVSTDGLIGRSGSEVAAAGGNLAPVRPLVLTRVLTVGADSHEVAQSTAVTPEFTLTAGRYRIEASMGTHNAKAVQDIDVEAGVVRRVVLKPDAGVVMLRLTTATAAAMAWEVMDSKGDLVVRTQQSHPRLTLAPGRYLVHCDVDDRRIDKRIDISTDPQPRIIDF